MPTLILEKITECRQCLTYYIMGVESGQGWTSIVGSTKYPNRMFWRYIKTSFEGLVWGALNRYVYSQEFLYFLMGHILVYFFLTCCTTAVCWSMGFSMFGMVLMRLMFSLFGIFDMISGPHITVSVKHGFWALYKKNGARNILIPTCRNFQC